MADNNANVEQADAGATVPVKMPDGTIVAMPTHPTPEQYQRYLDIRAKFDANPATASKSPPSLLSSAPSAEEVARAVHDQSNTVQNPNYDVAADYKYVTSKPDLYNEAWAERLLSSGASPTSPADRALFQKALQIRAQAQARKQAQPAEELAEQAKFLNTKPTPEQPEWLSDQPNVPQHPTPNVGNIGDLDIHIRQPATVSNVVGGLIDSAGLEAYKVWNGMLVAGNDARNREDFSPEENARKDQEAEQAKQKIVMANAFQDQSTPMFDTKTGETFYSAAQGFANYAPEMAAFLINPVAGAGAMGVASAAAGYGKYRARGATPTEAALGGGAEGAIMAATSMLPLGYVTRHLGRDGVTQFVGGMVERGVLPLTAQGIAMSAVDTAIANPKTTWSDWLHSLPDTVQQSVATALIFSASAVAAHGGLRAFKNVIRPDVDQTRSQQAQTIDNIVDPSKNVDQAIAAAHQELNKGPSVADQLRAIRPLGEDHGATRQATEAIAGAPTGVAGGGSELERNIAAAVPGVGRSIAAGPIYEGVGAEPGVPGAGIGAAEARPVETQEVQRATLEQRQSQEARDQFDALYTKAVNLVAKNGSASVSLLQRNLVVPYMRAERIIQKMQDDGIVSAPNINGQRQIVQLPSWVTETALPRQPITKVAPKTLTLKGEKYASEKPSTTQVGEQPSGEGGIGRAGTEGMERGEPRTGPAGTSAETEKTAEAARVAGAGKQVGARQVSQLTPEQEALLDQEQEALRHGKGVISIPEKYALEKPKRSTPDFSIGQTALERAKRAAVRADIAVNRALGGEPEETLSARAERQKEESRLAAAGRTVLNAAIPGHTERAAKATAERQRAAGLQFSVSRADTLSDLHSALMKKYPLFDLDMQQRDPRTLELKSIAFNPADRGKGYGGQVLSDIKAYAAAHGIEKITLMSAPKARDFYEQNGFVKSAGTDQYAYTVQHHVSPKDHLINIGLNRNDGGTITAEEARKALADAGAHITDSAVHTSNTEQTLVAKIDRPLSDDAAHNLSRVLHQDAIAQFSNGAGKLHGPQAARWGDFNPDYFLDLNGRPMSHDRAAPVSVEGTHFSNVPRETLSGAFYGTGLRGAEARRLAESADPRLKNRLAFYVDEGKGVRPEAGVGNIKHTVKLNNLYDIGANQLRLPADNLNNLESAILDHGYNGYYLRDWRNNQGAAVLLGDAAKAVRPEAISGAGKNTINVDGIYRPALNSDGRPIHPTTEGIKNFWRWFGNSKIVDDQGRPQVMYHGTTADVEAFKARQADAIFVTPNKEFASDFVQRYDTERAQREGQNVMPLYVKAENPFDLDNAQHIAGLRQAVGDKFAPYKDMPFSDSVDDVAAGRLMAVENPVVQDYIKAHHDGFYVYEQGEKNLAVYDPTQIKSAMGNVGEFGKRQQIQFSVTNTEGEETMYSPLLKAVMEMKMNSATPEQWKATLKGLTLKGIKPEEMEHTGVMKYLDEGIKRYENKPITRADLESYIKRNQVLVTPKVYGYGAEGANVSSIDFDTGDWETEEPDMDWLRESAIDRAYGMDDNELKDYLDRHDITDENGEEPSAEMREKLLARFATIGKRNSEGAEPEIEAMANNVIDKMADDEYNYYYDSGGAPQTRRIEVTAGNRNFEFHDRLVYGERELYSVDGKDMVDLGRNTSRLDDADIEGAIRSYLAENYDLHEADEEAQPRFEQFTLPGGDNYRERLLINANHKGEPFSYRNHFEDENTIAHTRVDDRETPIENIEKDFPDLAARLRSEGKTKAKIYFLEELQSDWAQHGREQVTQDMPDYSRQLMDMRSTYNKQRHALEDDMMNATRPLLEYRNAKLGDITKWFDEQVKTLQATEYNATTYHHEAAGLQQEYRDRRDSLDKDYEAKYRAIVIPYEEKLNAAENDYFSRRDKLNQENNEYRKTHGMNAFDVYRHNALLEQRRSEINKQLRELEYKSAREQSAGLYENEEYRKLAEAESFAEYTRLTNELENVSYEKQISGEVGTGAYVTSTDAWVALAMKDAVSEAVRKGYDLVAWTTGDQQTQRWSGVLRQKVDTIAWEKSKDGVIHIRALQNGNERANTKYGENDLSAAIGKTMAERIIKDPNQSGEIKGDDIVVADLGITKFYGNSHGDNPDGKPAIMTKVANQVLKKLGGDKIREANLHEQKVILPEKYEKKTLVTVAQARYILETEPDVEIFNEFGGRIIPERAELIRPDDGHEYYAVTNRTKEVYDQTVSMQPAFEITPKMREEVLKGLPQFSRAKMQQSKISSPEDAIATLPSGMRKAVQRMTERANLGKTGGIVLGSEEQNMRRAAEMLATKHGTTVPHEWGILESAMRSGEAAGEKPVDLRERRDLFMKLPTATRQRLSEELSATKREGGHNVDAYQVDLDMLSDMLEDEGKDLKTYPAYHNFTFEGMPLTSEFTAKPKINGFYHPDIGTVFVNLDKVSPAELKGVIAHEINHAANNNALNAEVMKRLQGKTGDDIYGRVNARLERAGQAGNPREATSYLLEEAMNMGRAAGHSRLDQGFFGWAQKALPEFVVNALKKWTAAIRAAMYRSGIFLKAHDLTIDDFVAINQASMKALARGELEPAQAEYAQPSAGKPAGKPVAEHIGKMNALMGKLRDTADALADEFKMAVAPMAAGKTDAYRAIAKDYANAERIARWQWAKFDDVLKKNYTEDQLKEMWDAADEQNELLSKGLPTTGMGLDRLSADQRETMDVMHQYGEALMQRAKKEGMFFGEGVPYWAPRTAVAIGEDGEYIRPSNILSSSKEGRNFTISSPNLMRRKYVTSAETEEAMKAKGLKLVRNIRTMPLAMERLERAIAGRALINQIKELGSRVGEELVSINAGNGYFTLDHPAFKTYRPRMIEVDGKYTPAEDQNGEMIFDKVPLYMRDDLKGPIKAILSQPGGSIYNALMSLKGKAMSVIMYSPLIHNAVEFGRALPIMPGKMLTLRMYFDGNKAKNDPVQMRQAISDGMVPIGHRGGFQDISGMMEGATIEAGRSLTAKAIGGGIGLLNKAAGEAAKRGIDTVGDIWHNTLLWDRVGDLQMGLYVNLRRLQTEKLIKQGLTQEAAEGTAGKIAAHMANRYAGALPNEAMSAMTRKLTNLALFSRSFTMGNLGVMKDIFTGLPKDVQAQIVRDYGELALRAGKDIARRKALAAFIMDIGLMYAMTSLTQDAFDMMKRDKSLGAVGQGYADRFSKLLHKVEKNPLAVLNSPLDSLQSLSSTSANEPGKEDRVLYGYDKSGTAIYIRLPTGKIGEEFIGWATSPLEMLKRKESTFLRPIDQTLHNDLGFGRRVYNPDDPGVAGAVRNAGKIVTNAMLQQIPNESIQAIIRGARGEGNDMDAYKVLGPLFGLTFSRGAPGGPAVGEMFKANQERRAMIADNMPEIRQMILAGKQDQAVQKMVDIGMTQAEIRLTLTHVLNPAARLNAGALKRFERTATEEQKEKMRQLQQH